MLKELTKKYVEAFDGKNLDKISELLTDNFTLEDPIVKRIEGKANALHTLANIFNSCNTLTFLAKNIYQDKQTTIIEFVLKLDNVTLFGTNIIEWQDNKMKGLRAYLDTPRG